MKYICLCLLLVLSRPVFGEIITYKAPKCSFLSDAYELKIREGKGAWQQVDSYYANVAKVINTKTDIRKTSFAYFDCSGEVEVNLTVKTGKVKSVRIRPSSLGIQSVIRGNSIYFTIRAGQAISIEVNGEIFENMQLFANPLEMGRPSLADTNVIYYGPGIHSIGKLKVKSNKTIYIAGGAIVEGSIIADHVSNVRIAGRGILTQTATASGPDKGAGAPGRPSRNDELTVAFSDNISIDGIIILPHKYSLLIGQSSNVKVSNIKSFSSEGNADGIDIFCSSDVTLDHIYMRNSDDCIAIYGHRWNYYGNTKNIAITNAVLWADVAHPVLIGTHGDSIHPDTLSDIRFAGIEVLDQHENQMDYQGCFALNAGDSNLIKDVSFENVNIDQIRKGQLFNLRIMFNKKYNTSAGNRIENLLFKNVFYTGQDLPISIITGYDELRGIKNVVFDNLRINGRVITDDMGGKPSFYKTGDMANIFIGEHVSDIRFIQSSVK